MKPSSRYLSLFTTSLALLALVAGSPACGEPDGPAAPVVNGEAGADAASTGADASAAAETGAVPDATADGATKGDAGLTQVQAYCDAVASHGTCPGQSPRPCEAEGKCIYGGLMTAAAAASYNACYASPSCKGDDSCATEAGLASGGAAATTYLQSCSAKAESCGSAKDLCDPALYAYRGIGEAMSACLTQACGGLAACREAALKPIRDCK